MKRFWIILFLALTLVVGGIGTDAYAKKSGGGSSRSSGGSSYKSSSKPKAKGKPKANKGYDSGASSSKKKADSQKNYQKSSGKSDKSKTNFKKSKVKPTTFTTPGGKTIKIDRTTPSAQRFERSYSQEQYVTRGRRSNDFYGSSYGGYRSRTVIHHYNDPFDSIFYFWILDQSINQQARWMHHHRASMDQARLNQMYAENAQLQAQVEALSGTPVNPDFTPPGADYDLMYSDDYVAASAGVGTYATPIPLTTPINPFPFFGLILFSIIVGVGFVIVAVLILQD